MGETVKFPREDYTNFLELFLFEKKAARRAPRTIHDYKLHVSMFFKRFPRALRSEKELPSLSISPMILSPLLLAFVEKN